ncbi:MAG: cellulase family glycosylhydrolase, partial [Candidatus Omnitrophica bacterium]|nr:cellulase family glycosylhydrolase [Candidatus Omnitrophota bacterium]
TLKGINLGNVLLIEPWMTGITVGDPVKADDDYNIREKLIARFGLAEANRLFEIFQNSYLNEYDMDEILRTGSNLVRLPIYYRAIRDIDETTGQWKAGSAFNFTAIDRIVQWCEDRGLYVLLDLHGAPGAQSKEMHSGRTSADTPSAGFYHKLFHPTDTTYRQRTVELWQAISNRYKFNPTVMGYDLLNEPFGAIDPVYYPNRANGIAALWALYDQLYKAIRVNDTKHIIVMESIPSDKDWDTLPPPSQFSWTNVMYQFHYYGFRLNAAGKIVGVLTPDEQKQYLISGAAADCAQYPHDNKFCGKLNFSKQNQYNVPVLIGEFNAFDQRSMWDLYLQTFYEQNWSWTMWSYKHHPPRELWGLYTHLNYNDVAPNLSVDSAPVIEQKFAKYDTLIHHEPNITLFKVLREYLSRGLFVLQSSLAGRTPNAVTEKWYPVSLPKTFQKLPVVILGIETFNSAETSGVRMKQLCRNRFEVRTQDDNPLTLNPAEVISYFALPSGLIQNKTGASIGEAGRVTAYQKDGSQWHTVKLSKTYTEPVVFMQINTFHGRQPAHIRLRSVGSGSFQFQIEEWDYLDQKHLLEDVSYMVLEKGKHQLTDGRRVEVGKASVSSHWSTVNLTSGLAAAPIVISQCQTVNESPAVITRERNITAGGLEIKLQEEKAGNGVHAAETVGYLAAELTN